MEGELLLVWSRCQEAKGHAHMETRPNGSTPPFYSYPLSKQQISEGLILFLVMQMCDCPSFIQRNTSEGHQGPPEMGPGCAWGEALRATSLRNTNRSHQTAFPTQKTPGAQLKFKDQSKKKPQGHLTLLHEGPSSEMHRCLICSWVENGVQLC